MERKIIRQIWGKMARKDKQMNRMELSDRIARMWLKSRTDAGLSQDRVAKALGVSKKTVQNWESGEASPNFRMALEWFDALGVPMYPYIMSMLYPVEVDGITAATDMYELRKALHCYVDELDDLHARELLFILHGLHGSSPIGTLDACTAYLHLPLSMRVCITDSIVTHYEMAAGLGLLQNEDHVAPEISTLEQFLSTARNAVKAGKQSYTFMEERE